MNSRDAIQQELTDLRSSLPIDANKQPVFTVPEGYFENFAASVLAALKRQQQITAADELEHLSPVLAAIPKHTPYHVPENYFSDLATDLPALVSDEALPGFLQTHTKQMPYSVPSGYFDELAAQVAAKVTTPQAKVIPLRTRFMRYAAAAVLVGFMVMAGFFYSNRSGSVALDPAKQPDAWVAQKLKNIPKKDIEAFLKTVDAGLSSRGMTKKGGTGDVQVLLRDVSTTELDAFLKQVPSDADFSSMN
jgi:hypothetical protein